MTREEFVAKVEHEGGVEGALSYGLRLSDLPQDTPEHVRVAWRILEDAQINIEIIEDWLENDE